MAREGEVADRVTFVEGDLFTADISKATVVTLWLSTSVNLRLEAKLKRELRPGTRIVSRQFPIGEWPPDQTVHVGDEILRLWTIPPAGRQTTRETAKTAECAEMFLCDLCALGGLQASVTDRDAVYAAIASMSSLVRFATTGFIRSAQTPLRVPCCVSNNWRTV